MRKFLLLLAATAMVALAPMEAESRTGKNSSTHQTKKAPEHKHRHSIERVAPTPPDLKLPPAPITSEPPEEEPSMFDIVFSHFKAK